MESMLSLLARHKQGAAVGITAVCSSHPLVLEAALRLAATWRVPLLVEATSNQVDQFGGYTGMTPDDFRQQLYSLAEQCGVAREQLMLGGDHLGPNSWQGLPAAEAMEHAGDLIESYVAAGFKKIHLDCSMACADDPLPLTDEVVAKRAAHLALRAEQTCIERYGHSDLLYVIGTEVPMPGGAREDVGELAVTTPQAASRTLDAHRTAFESAGLDGVWARVIAMVVQPGVEFDHARVVDYQPHAARALSPVIEREPHMVFEAHSTDYQMPDAYRALVHDHFAILKVGPALTFALREALFSLAAIESEMVIANACSGLRRTLEQTMLEQPEYWQHHYVGDANTQRLSRSFSYSDRIRYYWPDSRVDEACRVLFANLQQAPIALPLLSQYMPIQYHKVRACQLQATARELVIDQVQTVLSHYFAACYPHSEMVL